MLDDLEGKKTGERLRIIRERKGMSRPVLAGLVGYSAEWLKGIESGRRLPPRLPVLVRLAEVLAVGDVAVLAGSDMDLGGQHHHPHQLVRAHPHEAVPAIREAVRAPLLTVTGQPSPVAALRRRTSDAWRLWHTSQCCDVFHLGFALVNQASLTGGDSKSEEL
ncbi:Transcriptional regulator, contains XRE-family HTH domain [Nonomuraea solani]|uniref:Transcriptional regulator, contains XRE-family HTH domain n=1 Tax=Nonomuraea solani TaxID=1144553 RepID=A0A1H6ETH7_9ACTN|nr:helix-turn-helix transcriptional regulator [Nonomuraea solani]SEH00381.1 Transcriptional regulator, contains XRE-family HTH domain [Nonomuraea solani]